MKKVIGIVPSARLFTGNDPYEDNYYFVNQYVRRVEENGGIPVGLLAVDGKIRSDALDICDAFLLCGGRRIWPYHFQVVDYAVRRKKPMLGICLGMQAIGSYFRVAEEAKKRDFSGDLLELYVTMKKERYMFTLPVEHHWDVPFTYETLEETKHGVTIAPGTHLHALLGPSIKAVTLHHYKLNGAPETLIVSARTEDGIIEGVEYDDYVLGVQFHPEAVAEFDALFRFLTKS